MDLVMQCFQLALGWIVVMAIEAALDFIEHLLAVLDECVDCRGVRGVFEQEILLNRLDVGEEVFSQNLDLVEGDDGFELPDHVVDRSRDVEAAHNQDCCEKRETDKNLSLH
jgi:hypothetical protein